MPEWSEALLWITAAASLLTSLARELPWQNVLLAAAVIGGIAGGASAVAWFLGWPGFFAGTSEWALFQFPGAGSALLWIVALLSSRGVARLILRRRRESSFYGFELIGLTTVLAATLDLEILDRFSWKYNWERPLVRLLTALLIQVLITPALMRKKPGKVAPAFHPLYVWTALNLLLAVVESIRDLKLQAGMRVGIATAVVVASLIGVRTGKRDPAAA